MKFKGKIRGDMAGKKTVILLDEKVENRENFCRLVQENFIVVEVENVNKAIRKIEELEGRVSTIIINLSTSCEDPFLLIGKFKEHYLVRKVPVLAIINRDDISLMELALDYGAEDVISFPITKVVMQRRLINIVNRYEYETNHIIEMDSLTQIYNKETFERKTVELLHRQNTVKFVLVRLNIGKFKVINDLYGTRIGDICLQEIAKEVKEIAENGTYGRLVADHFVMCVPKTKNYAKNITEKIHEALSGERLGYHLDYYVGLYEIINRELPVDIMCDRALLAMNAAKNVGGPNYAIYNEGLRDELLREQRIVSEMNGALVRNEFVVYLQPKSDLNTGTTIGAEALVRWIHPKQGIIMPGEFISIFEKNGFIIKLDMYVWEKACQLLREWIDQGRMPIPISVNVSRAHMYNTRLCEELVGLVKKYDLNPKLLELELTESAYVANSELLQKVLQQLHAAGFVIMMDDFGSGYSSLNMLKEIDVDVLKIDIAFLSGKETLGRGANILSSVVRLAKRINLPVIIEGVETKKQIDFLRSIGCRYGQGYYFAKPMPIASFENLLHKAELNAATIKRVEEENGVDIDELWNPNAQVNLLFNSIISAVGIFEMYKGEIEIVRTNDGFLSLFDIQVEMESELENVFWEGLSKENLEKIHVAFSQSLLNRNCSETEFMHINKQGDAIYLDARVCFLSVSGEKSVYYVAINDISKTKKAEDELSIQEEKYALLVEHTRIEYFDYEVEKDCMVYAVYNEKNIRNTIRIENYIGYLPKSEHIHPDDRNKLLAIFNDTIDIVYEGKTDFRMRIIGEKYHKYNCHYVTIANNIGRIKRFIGRFYRVDEFGTLAYNQVMELVQTMFVDSPGGVCRLEYASGKFDIIYANEAFYAMRGYTREQYLEETKGNAGEVVLKSSLEKSIEVLEKAIFEKRNAINYILDIITRNGEHRKIFCGDMIIYEEDKIFIVGIEHDVTNIELGG